MSAPLVQTTQDVAEFIRFIVSPSVLQMGEGKMIREGDLWARPQHGGQGFSRAEVEELTLYVTCVMQKAPRMVLFYGWSYEGE